MEWLEITGYVASALAFATFCMKSMLPLRYIAACSNVAFIAYGYFSQLYPVLLLHLLLLPLNCVRIVGLRHLTRELQRLQELDHLPIASLLPFCTRKRFKAGDALFKKGDRARHVYYVLDGVLRIDEVKMDICSGQIAGVMGVFSPEKARPWSAHWATDAEALELCEEKVLELIRDDPAFSMSLTKTICRRTMTMDGLSRHSIPVRSGPTTPEQHDPLPVA